MTKKIAFCFFLFSLTKLVLGGSAELFGQIAGDYRSSSTTSGNWSSLSMWETYNGSAWVAASSLPTSTNDVLIRAQTVTIDNSSAQCRNLSFSNNTGTSNISLSVASGVLSIYGDATFRDHKNSISSWTAGARLVFAGTANQLLTTGTQSRFYSLEINKSSGSVTQQTGATIRIENSISVSNGGSFVLGSATNIEGVQFSDGTTATTPSISIGVNSTMTINGSSAVRSGTSGSSPISSVSVFGTLNLTSTSSTTKLNFGDVTIGNGTDAATLNITGNWSAGIFNFNSITVNNQGNYNLTASSTGTCSQGTAVFNNGSNVVYGVGASSGLPFADTNYYNLTMGRNTTWIMTADRTINNNLIVNGGIFTISGNETVTASLSNINISGTCQISNNAAIYMGHAKFNSTSDLDIISGTFDGGAVAKASVNNSSIHTFGGNINISGGTLNGASANSNRSIFNINGNINLSSGNFYASSNSKTTFNIDGDINISGGTMIGTTAASANPELNIEGGLFISGAGICKASNVVSPTTTTMLYINFTNASGLNNSSNLFVSTGLSNYEGLWSFSISSGRTITLQSDIEMGSNTPTTTYTSFDLQSGGTLKLGSKLIIGISGSNDSRFNNSSNSTLEIGHAGGITLAGTSDGNIQTTTRSFVTTAHYTYNGNSNQNTGTALPSSIKNLIIDNSGGIGNNTLTLSNSNLSVGSNTCTIQAGIFDVGTNTFNGSSGNLIMNGGTLKIAKLSSVNTIVFPELDGTYTINTGTIELYGAGPQILRGGNNYYNIVFSGSNTPGVDYKNVTSAITISNNLDISGSAILNAVDVSGNAVSISGNGGLSMSGTSRFRMKILNNTLPELTATNPGTTYSITGGSIELYGSGATQTQSLRGTYGSGTNVTYNNIDINASAANNTFTSANVVLGASIYINGNLTVYNPATFQISALYSLRGSGNVEIKPGATLQYGSADGINTSTTTGNIRVSGTRTLSTSANYGFVGTVSMVSGNQLPATVNNLFIYKTGNANCTLSQGLSVNGTLSMKSGNIITSSSNLLQLSETSAVNSASHYSFVDGPILKKGNTSFIYPVGKVSYYRPIGISAPALESDEFTAEYFLTDPNSLYNVSQRDINLKHVSRCEYWMLNRTTGTSGVNVTLSWDSVSCGVTDMSTLAVARWDGSSWKDHGNGGTSGANDSGNVVTSNPVSSFSPFTLASTLDNTNPLPIELISFTGKYSNESVQLDWLVGYEKNNNYYTLYRTSDAKNYTEIAQINSRGNINSLRKYQYIDKEFLNGINYYALTQTDFDGKKSTPKIIAVHTDSKKLNNYVIYSDIENSRINLSYTNSNENSKIRLEIIDLSGRVIYNKNIEVHNGSGIIEINSTHIARGFYLLRMYDGIEFKNIKFVY